MVQRRRAVHPSIGSIGSKRSPGAASHLTAPDSDRLKRRRVEQAITPRRTSSSVASPARRRSSRDTVRRQTKPSELTASGRRRRAQQPPRHSAAEPRTRSNAQPATRKRKLSAPVDSQNNSQSRPDSALGSTAIENEPSDKSAQTQKVLARKPRPRRLSKPSKSLCRQDIRSRGSASAKHLVTRHRAATSKAQQSADSADGQAIAPSDDGAATETPDSPRSQDQQRLTGRRRRTHGTPHPTFRGVKTSSAGITHMVVHPDVKHVWSAFVLIPSKQKHRPERMLFLGKNYWTAEAAARAVDRASIALHGRAKASTNFPLERYGPEVIVSTIKHSHLAAPPHSILQLPLA